VGRSGADNVAAYTSANFRSTTFLNALARLNPHPYSAADNLDADAASRTRALAAGLPANFLLVNPDLLGGALIVGNMDFEEFAEAVDAAGIFRSFGKM